MAESQEVESIEVPVELLKRLEPRIEATEFKNKSEYITHILEEVLYELEQESDHSAAGSVDEQQVQERLKSLGYLNE
ncbi:hypothetical protein [Halohasta salina]|uniref:hypothetical protein n=1 Tax=Halohasta salina TaxID=2961621 RepID=UPI0020A553E2|nr:hypothetical protein [Halohasta salina]